MHKSPSNCLALRAIDEKTFAVGGRAGTPGIAHLMRFAFGMMESATPFGSAILIEGDEGSAQIISFHGALHRLV